MKTILFEGVPNTKLTVVALDKLLKNAGVKGYVLTETRMDDGEDYTIPIFVLGVELDDEDATLISLKYSTLDLVNMLLATVNEMLKNLTKTK